MNLEDSNKRRDVSVNIQSMNAKTLVVVGFQLISLLWGYI